MRERDGEREGDGQRDRERQRRRECQRESVVVHDKAVWGPITPRGRGWGGQGIGLPWQHPFLGRGASFSHRDTLTGGFTSFLPHYRRVFSPVAARLAS